MNKDYFDNSMVTKKTDNMYQNVKCEYYFSLLNKCVVFLNVYINSYYISKKLHYNLFKFHSMKKNNNNKLDVEVKNWGTVINKDEPFLAASPDGTIDDDMLLEIKCPVKSIGELLNNKSYDICKENDTITVNKSGRNEYYTQI